MSSLHEISATNIHGETTELSQYKGKYSLIVNVASECGLTPQYEGLESLFEKLSDKAFTILGFPCNQFGAQEPGSESQILAGCVNKYAIKFPMFSKIDVNGEDTHPVYEFLKNSNPEISSEDITWNFEKFLVDPQGQVIKRFSPKETPAEVEAYLTPLI